MAIQVGLPAEKESSGPFGGDDLLLHLRPCETTCRGNQTWYLGHAFRNVKQVGLTVCFLFKVVFINSSQVITNIFEVDDASKFPVKNLRLGILSNQRPHLQGLNPLV